jgi:hypothetical protein
MTSYAMELAAQGFCDHSFAHKAHEAPQLWLRLVTMDS